MRQKKRQTTEKETRHQRRPARFASLSEDKMQQILTESHYGKTKQITNWSVSTFKGKLKFFRFKIVKYETRAFNGKISINPIPTYIFCLFCLIFLAYREQSLLILLSVFRVGFDAQFHWPCYKTIGSCF